MKNADISPSVNSKEERRAFLGVQGMNLRFCCLIAPNFYSSNILDRKKMVETLEGELIQA